MDEWPNKSVIYSLSEAEKIKLVDYLFIVKCSIYLLLPSKYKLDNISCHPKNALTSYLSTQHNSRECHLIPFLIKTISFSLWSLIICQSTILTYQVLMIRSPQKRNSRRDVGVNLVQRSGMYNVIIVISVIFRDSWSSALKKSVN